MEDRTNEALYLELSNAAPSEAEQRAGELVKLAGAHRVHWYDNAHPNRTDLPPKVKEGTMLVVAEVDRTFRGQIRRSIRPHTFLSVIPDRARASWTVPRRPGC